MKLYALLEDIFRTIKDPTELSVSVNTHERKHRGSDRESIATVTPLPLRSTASKTRGIPVYYGFSYLHSPEVTELLKGFKGKNDLRTDPRQISRFFTDTVAYMAHGLKLQKVKPDVIVSPKSTAPAAHEFAEQLSKAMGCELYQGSFSKSDTFVLPHSKDDALRAIMDKFVDHDHLADKYHGSDIEKFTKRVAQSIYSSFKTHGKLELKSVDKQTSKFIKGFMETNANLVGKNVLVVDDILSSGATMSEMLRLAQEAGAASTVGAVIFNMTTSKS